MKSIKLFFAALFISPVLTFAQTGPIDELIDILNNYKTLLAAAENEEQYENLSAELLQMLDEMEKKYPDFEPTDAQMEQIAAVFNSFQGEVEETADRLGIELPDNEEKGFDPEVAESIKEMLEEYDDIDEKVYQLISLFTVLIEDVETEDEFVSLTSMLESISNEIITDGYEPKEENAERLSEAANKLGNAIGELISRLE